MIITSLVAYIPRCSQKCDICTTLSSLQRIGVIVIFEKRCKVNIVRRRQRLSLWDHGLELRR